MTSVGLLVPRWLAAGDIAGHVKAVGFRDAGNAVVYVEEVTGREFSPPEKAPVISQKDLTFVPHVLPILAGSQVEFLNSDSVLHNVYSPSTVAKKFNLGTYPRGISKSVKFDKPGQVVVLCNVHAEMSAYILVLQNPFFAVPGKDGSFAIKNVPAGKYQLKLWHEKIKARSVKTVEVPSEGTLEVSFELKR